MSRLPFTGEWAEELIDRRLDFLEAAARFVPPGEVELDRRGEEPTREGRGGATDVRALFAAADLALATGRTERGLRGLADCARSFVEAGDRWSAVLPGVVSGTCAVFLRSGFIHLRFGEESAITYTEDVPAWTPEGLQARFHVLLAVLNSPDEDLRGLALLQDGKQEQELSLGEPLVEVLAAFGLRRELPGRDDSTDVGDRQDGDYQIALQALTANSVQWGEELRLYRKDSYHWQQMRARGMLVDLRRVALEMALARRQDATGFWKWRAQDRRDGLAGEIDRFVRDLTTEIARTQRWQPG